MNPKLSVHDLIDVLEKSTLGLRRLNPGIEKSYPKSQTDFIGSTSGGGLLPEDRDAKTCSLLLH